MAATDLDLGRYQLGWSDAEDYVFKPKKGLNESIVREMSEMKGEPEWMRTFRLRALKNFERKPMAPWFAAQMPNLDFDDIYYYIKPTGGQVDGWADLPDAIKNTYEKLGIPEAERKYLSGVTAQYECVRSTTRVWTTRGMRMIKELAAGDEVFALDDRCPHKAGPLSEGIVHGHKVTCPLHSWVIELADGQAVAPDVGCAPPVPVKLVDGTVWLKVVGARKAVNG